MAALPPEPPNEPKLPSSQPDVTGEADVELTKSEKSAIYREELKEQYRADVRSRLTPTVPPTFTSKSGLFLNSAFGLWVLSAIFLSGGGTMLSCYQKHRDISRAAEEKALEERKIRLEKELEREQERSARVERLDTEISYRLSQTLLDLRNVSEQTALLPQNAPPPQRVLAAASATFPILQGMIRPPSVSQAPLYPEHAQWGLPTLIADLAPRVSKKERQELQRCLAQMQGGSNRQGFKTADPAREAASWILEDIVLSRWRDSAFHHVDCRPSNPFC